MLSVNLLIKPASGNCNMSGIYCFYRDVIGRRNVRSYGMMNHLTIESFNEIDKNREAIRFIKQSSTEDECKACQWFGLCRGGCRRYRETPRGISLNYYCATGIYGFDVSWESKYPNSMQRWAEGLPQRGEGTIGMSLVQCSSFLRRYER